MPSLSASTGAAKLSGPTRLPPNYRHPRVLTLEVCDEATVARNFYIPFSFSSPLLALVLLLPSQAHLVDQLNLLRIHPMHQSRWILLVLAALTQADPVEISDTDYDSLDGAGIQILAIDRSVPFSHSPKITIDPYQVPTVPSLQLRPLNRGQDVSSTDGVAVVRTSSDGVHEYPDGISATEYDSYDNDSMLEVLDDHGASISTPPDLHVVVKHEIPELTGEDVIEIPPIDLIIAADDSEPSSDLQDAPNIHLVFQTAQQAESSNQTLTNATDFFGLRNTTHQSPKTDNSANSDILFDDTELFHDLAQSDTDAVEICKSYAFDPSQINYHISQTDEWLRDYARKNAENPFFRQHGLIATVAFDHLGINNFICSIGTEHLCRIDCPTVVKSIDDLHLARRVYFALASASNFLTTTSIIHVSPLSA